MREVLIRALATQCAQWSRIVLRRSHYIPPTHVSPHLALELVAQCAGMDAIEIWDVLFPSPYGVSFFFKKIVPLPRVVGTMKKLPCRKNSNWHAWVEGERK